MYDQNANTRNLPYVLGTVLIRQCRDEQPNFEMECAVKRPEPRGARGIPVHVLLCERA